MNDSNGSRSMLEVRPQLFVASAQSSEVLLDLVTAYRTMLARPAPGLRLQDLCYSARARHRDGNERLGVVAQSVEDLAAQLDSVMTGEASTMAVRRRAPARARGKLAFVFSGQGSQWLGMGCQLFAREPVFRAALEQCDEEIHALLSWSVIEQLFATPAAARLDDIDVVQPALFAFQVALAALWRSWGITPDVVVGHSVGELAAAHIAGVLSLPDAARIVCARSQVSTHPCARGAMAVIGLPASEVEALIAPSRDRVWVSIHESPESTVISGDSQAVDRIVAEVLARDVFGRRVKAPVAGHCPMWDPLREPLLDLIATIRPQAASVRLQSTVDLQLDAQANDGAAMGPAYWWPNLRQPVLFAQAMRKLLADGVDTFLEIGPHPILCHAMLQCAKHADVPIATLHSTRRNEDECTLLLSSLAAFYVQGRDIEWPAVCDGTPPPVMLPDMPWQPEGLQSTLTSAEPLAQAAAHGEHPMLGRQIALQGACVPVVTEIGELRVQPLEAPRSGRDSGAVSHSKLTADLIGHSEDPRDTGAGTSQQPVLAQLLATEEGQRAPRLEALLSQYLASVLGRQVARIRPDVGLNQLGLDSLMALELRNRIRADLDVAPPLALLVVSDVSLRDLAREILHQLATKAQESLQRPEDVRATHQGTGPGTDDLTDDQIRALLRDLDGDG